MVLENLKSTDNLKSIGLEELNLRDARNTDAGWFGPMGFGFRVYFRIDTKSLFGDPLSRNPQMA